MLNKSTILLLALTGVLAACGGQGPASQTGSTQGQNDAASSTPDVAESKDVASGPDVPQASCVGSSMPKGFESLDQDCAFLAKCSTLGKCYCGDKCPTDKTPKCDPAECATTSPKCFCGEQCGADQKKCPAYICDPLDIKDCQEQDDCVYNSKPWPAWCTCQKMPDHAPDCWCGKPCSPDKPQCAASKCAGKNPDKCIVVPGAPYTSCYCSTCGLFGNEPRCFFPLCP